MVFKNSVDPVDGLRKWHFNKPLWVYYNKSRGMRVPKALQKAGAYKTLLCEDFVLVSQSCSAGSVVIVRRSVVGNHANAPHYEPSTCSVINSSQKLGSVIL